MNLNEAVASLEHVPEPHRTNMRRALIWLHDRTKRKQVTRPEVLEAFRKMLVALERLSAVLEDMTTALDEVNAAINRTEN